MRDQQIIGLWEAYQQINQLDEVKTATSIQNDRIPDFETEKKIKQVPGLRVNKPSSPPVEEEYKSSNKGRIARQTEKAYKTERRALDTGDAEEAMRQNRRRNAMNNPAGRRNELDAKNKPTTQNAHFEPEMDLFDYLLEHLVSEGYADTNENAIAIMANMSEEWRQSIVEMGENIGKEPKTVGGPERPGVEGETYDNRAERMKPGKKPKGWKPTGPKLKSGQRPGYAR